MRPRPLLSGLGALLVAAWLALAAACTAIVEEDAYAPLLVGEPKPAVLRKLVARPTIASIAPAVARPEGAPSRASVAEPQIVRLAATELDEGALTHAESEYLLQYDVWYFEDSEGERAVVLTFAEGSLSAVTSRRSVSWWRALR